MGRALGGALLTAGHRLTVWNRTASRASELVARGARLAESPADAVASAPLVLVNVVDHDVVDSLLARGREQLSGRLIVGLTADTPQRARRTAALVAEAAETTSTQRS